MSTPAGRSFHRDGGGLARSAVGGCACFCWSGWWRSVCLAGCPPDLDVRRCWRRPTTTVERCDGGLLIRINIVVLAAARGVPWHVTPYYGLQEFQGYPGMARPVGDLPHTAESSAGGPPSTLDVEVGHLRRADQSCSAIGRGTGGRPHRTRRPAIGAAVYPSRCPVTRSWSRAYSVR